MNLGVNLSLSPMAMGLPLFASIFLVLHLSFAVSSDQCLIPAKVSKFPYPSAVSAGACGYGPMAPGFNGGSVAGGSSALFRDGVGCGACFNLKCKDKKLCNTVGTKVVLTDLTKSNRTDFLLSDQVFTAQARARKASELNKHPILDVEYRRIPCEYNKNLSVMVEKGSTKPSNLVIKFLYQGGQTDILVVDVVTDGSSDYRFMSRKFGAVWETSNAPIGPIQFRLFVIGGYDRLMVYSVRPLPADWKVGAVYDLGVQITAVAKDGCSQTHSDAKAEDMK